MTQHMYVVLSVYIRTQSPGSRQHHQRIVLFARGCFEHDVGFVDDHQVGLYHCVGQGRRHLGGMQQVRCDNQYATVAVPLVHLFRPRIGLAIMDVAQLNRIGRDILQPFLKLWKNCV